MKTFKFNVSGTIVETTLETLSKAPHSKLYLFANINSPEIPFLDVNPFVFMVIIDYLRTGKLYVPANVSRDLVERIAQDYGVYISKVSLDISAHVQIQPSRSGDLPPSYDRLVAKHPISDVKGSNSNFEMAVLKRIENLVFRNLFQLLQNYYAGGCKNLMVFIMPPNLRKSEIANLSQTNFPEAYLNSSEPEIPDIEFLSQPKVLAILKRCIKSFSSAEPSCIMRSVTVRLENEFGIYDSKSVNILVITFPSLRMMTFK